jgi:choloylglycine hydrolase
MKKNNLLTVIILIIITVLSIQTGEACSTFMLKNGNELFYGHNLNQPGMNVPGLIFINKRGVFKVGRSSDEMLTKERSNPSTLSWISRYGSVTFSTFGKDMPDGGINEAGLYLWEMNDETQYPVNDKLPKLIQMNWMQYILDNFSTIDEAIQAAYDIEIGGWGWHYFVSDYTGKCASIEFINGEVVIHKGENMPVPGLFNEPYKKELNLLPYFKGFGGIYEPDLNNSKVPRFVKTAVMLRDYSPTQNAVDYGLKILKQLTVNEPPKWSVLIDARRKTIFFYTQLNPETKVFSYSNFDFSNNTPVQVLNMDIEEGKNVDNLFHNSTDNEINSFLNALPIPDGFFHKFGLTKVEFSDRFTNHYHASFDSTRHFFKGAWKVNTEESGKQKNPFPYTFEIVANNDIVSGFAIHTDGDRYKLDHLSMIGQLIKFTFISSSGTMWQVMGNIEGDKMIVEFGAFDYYVGKFNFYKI